MGLLTSSDSKMFRSWFKEMTRLRGIPVKYQYATSTSRTVHAEFDSEYSEPIDIDVIFDTNPRVNTLKRIGWISENANDKPYIVYLPYDIPHLNAESIITIPAQVDEHDDDLTDIEKNHVISGRRFKVTSINELIEYPDCWICTLAPVFDVDSSAYNNDYSNSNFNFMSETCVKDDEEDDGNGIELGLI